jgi:hypothetical protein
MPNAATGYALCVYDAAAAGRLVSSATVPGGRACGTTHPRPCWKESSTGFRYTDVESASEGVRSILLREGLAPGKARIVVVGKGVQLAVSSLLDFVPPVTVQLANRDGQCWEATYSVPAELDASQFKAKADPTPVPRPTRTARARRKLD